jgi:ABC-type glycerol-3-phosphate transport system permease component
MFPAAAAILPLFIRLRQLGLVDTPWSRSSRRAPSVASSRPC